MAYVIMARTFGMCRRGAVRKVHYFLYQALTPVRSNNDLIILDMWRKMEVAYSALTETWEWKRLNTGGAEHAGTDVWNAMYETMLRTPEYKLFHYREEMYFKYAKMYGRVVDDVDAANTEYTPQVMDFKAMFPEFDY